MVKVAASAAPKKSPAEAGPRVGRKWGSPAEGAGPANPRFNGARQELFLSRPGDSRRIARSAFVNCANGPGLKESPAGGQRGLKLSRWGSGGDLPSQTHTKREVINRSKKSVRVQCATPPCSHQSGREAPGRFTALRPPRGSRFLQRLACALFCLDSW
jgi:hypothetical protein